MCINFTQTPTIELKIDAKNWSKMVRSNNKNNICIIQFKVSKILNKAKKPASYETGFISNGH